MYYVCLCQTNFRNGLETISKGTWWGHQQNYLEQLGIHVWQEVLAGKSSVSPILLASSEAPELRCSWMHYGAMFQEGPSSWVHCLLSIGQTLAWPFEIQGLLWNWSLSLDITWSAGSWPMETSATPELLCPMRTEFVYNYSCWEAATSVPFSWFVGIIERALGVTCLTICLFHLSVHSSIHLTHSIGNWMSTLCQDLSQNQIKHNSGLQGMHSAWRREAYMKMNKGQKC